MSKRLGCNLMTDEVITVGVDRRLLKASGCLFVKQRAGYLSYAVDPKVLSFCFAPVNNGVCTRLCCFISEYLW